MLQKYYFRFIQHSQLMRNTELILSNHELTIYIARHSTAHSQILYLTD